jgi:hypothetical protein
MAGFATYCGAKDEQKDAADSEDDGDQFPLIDLLELALKLGFELNDLLLVLLVSVALAEPTCVGLRTGHQQAAGKDEDELVDLHVF